MEFKIVFKICGNDSRGLRFHDLKACKISRRCTARICLAASYEVHLLQNASAKPAGPNIRTSALLELGAVFISL
jgi:hypothetical protein